MSEAGTRTDDGEEHADDQVVEGRGGRTAAALGVALVVGALLAALIVFVASDAGEDEAEEVRLVIPAGTAATLAEGDDVDVVEDLLRLEVGEVLVVENADERPHVVGPLTAEPGEVVRQAFDAEGRYPGDTSVRLDGRLTILVEE